jgi:hypothetical protein
MLRNTEAHANDHCSRGIEISITYSNCVFLVLGIQHAMRVSRIILSYVTCLTVPCVSVASHHRHDLRGWGGGTLPNKKYKLIFSTNLF